MSKLLLTLLIMMVIPYLMGLLTIRFMPDKHKTIGVTYLSGFFLMLSFFQIVAVPVILTSNDFNLLVKVFTIGCILFAILGAVTSYKIIRAEAVKFRNQIVQISASKETVFLWVVFLISVGVQLYMAYNYWYPDGDDAYYVATSVVTSTSSSMYTISPYTGLTSELDARHALAPLPIFVAWLGRITGTHPTIIAHSCIPFILIPFSYLIYGLLGRFLVKEKKEYLPIFMILISIVNMWWNDSVYSVQSFFITRTWQGKAVLANIIIPAVLLCFFMICENLDSARKAGLWILLIAVIISGTLCSTMSILLIPLLIAILGIFAAVWKKNLSILIKSAISCIPAIGVAVLYFYLK